MIRPQTVETRAAVALADSVWRCYQKVFGDFDDYAGWRTELFERHAAREGFRLTVAFDDDSLVGFSWGYVGERGQYFSHLVSRALPVDVVDTWVGGHFELVELAVDPDYRGRGLGRLLHDQVLDGIRQPCLLSTTDDPDDPAVQLYLQSGWRRLGALPPDRQIMGRPASSRIPAE